MSTLLACGTHTAVDSLLFGGPVVGIVAWIKFDSWRRRNDPEPELAPPDGQTAQLSA